MIIEIKQPISKRKLHEALARVNRSKKKKTLRQHFGKLKRNLDGLTYQNTIRNEWD